MNRAGRDAQEAAGQVNIDNLAPLGYVVVADLCGLGRRPGGVEGKVHAAELGDTLLDRGLDFFVLGDVAGQGERRHVELALKLVGGLLRRFDADIDDGDTGTAAGALARGSEADARGAAGDEGDATVHASPFVGPGGEGSGDHDGAERVAEER
jgi:hypothetical protein